MITFDPEGLKTRLADLEEAMGAPGFWDDQQAAARISSEHARLARRLERYAKLSGDAADLGELVALASDDGELDESDLRIDTYRASGAGGQHVNKTDSAVRITHLPTGIVVQCQNERSQLSNRQTAMRILRSRLAEHELERREAELAQERGEVLDTGFGSQIRSYVLHPYQLVKDHRTEYETGNTQAVLNGALDEFIHEYLLARAAGRVV